MIHQCQDDDGLETKMFGTADVAKKIHKNTNTQHHHERPFGRENKSKKHVITHLSCQIGNIKIEHQSEIRIYFFFFL